MEWIRPRITPNRDARYMGLAWVYSAFSKDPNTQCGAVIISKDHKPLGIGFNGPPANIDDNAFNWSRPSKDDPEGFSKYSVVDHAETNAIDHSDKSRLAGSTLYVTGYPCKNCMLDIVRVKIARVVYMDFRSDTGSMLRASQRTVSEEVAQLGGVTIDLFNDDLQWLPDWIRDLSEKGIF